MFAEEVVVRGDMAVLDFRQFGGYGLLAEFEVAFDQCLVDMCPRLVGRPVVDRLGQFGTAFANYPRRALQETDL